MMDKFVIRGGRSLKGEVRVSGAKNAVLPMMAASLLTDGALHLENIPRLGDIRTIAALLQHLGVRVEGDRPLRGHPGEVESVPGRSEGAPALTLQAGALRAVEAPYDLVRTMRASVLVLGPLLARFGRARVSLPGGCAIGPRPINLHLAGLEKLGAEITLDEGYVEAKASRLTGARISFDVQTVTGTENLMMAATLAKGVTVLENAALEPEVVDLAELLSKMGAEVTGAGTSSIVIRGAEALQGASHRIIPDRIEAGTFAVASAVTGGEVLIKDCRPEHLEAVVTKLQEAGVEIKAAEGTLRVQGPFRPRATNVRTHPYPGFATDMQAQFMTLMSIAEGRSVITEAVFENRFMHVNELLRMGADIKVVGSAAFVQGVPALSGAPVMATDLRASASLVLAGLAAKGTTTVLRTYHLDRGYEALEEKLAALGADVERVKE